jgi:hypothetical protein
LLESESESELDEDVVDADFAAGGEFGKRSMPSRVAWNRKSPNARSTPLSRALKAGLETGEWGVNSTDPNRIELVGAVDPWKVELTGVDDPWLDEDEAGEIASPARAVPTDGANCRNIASADPSRDILGFRVMRTDARW